MREQQKIMITGHHSRRGLFKKKAYGVRFGAISIRLLLALFHGNPMEADDARNKIFCQLYGKKDSSRVSPKRFYVIIDPADEVKWKRYSDISTSQYSGRWRRFTKRLQLINV